MEGRLCGPQTGQEARGRQQGQGRLRAHARIAFDKFDGSGNLAAKAGFFGEFTFHAGNALDNRGMAAVEFFADFFKSQFRVLAREIIHCVAALSLIHI